MLPGNAFLPTGERSLDAVLPDLLEAFAAGELSSMSRAGNHQEIHNSKCAPILRVLASHLNDIVDGIN